MSKEISETPKVHPLIAALEKCDEPTVVFQGFLGTSESTVVRLYQALDTSSYMEIPKHGLVYLEAPESGEPGEVRLFVTGSIEILEVHKRHLRASDFTVRDFEDFPRPERAPTFWSCAGQCEGIFAGEVSQILIQEAQALTEQDPQKQAILLAEVARRKTQAQSALLVCLTTCLSRFPILPRFMAVPDDSPQGFHLEPFSLPRLHGLLVIKHLGKQT